MTHFDETEHPRRGAGESTDKAITEAADGRARAQEMNDRIASEHYLPPVLSVQRVADLAAERRMDHTARIDLTCP